MSRAGSRIDLTPLEFQILELLASEPGRAWSRNDLLDRVWSTVQGSERIENSRMSSDLDWMDQVENTLQSWSDSDSRDGGFRYRRR